MKVNIEEYIFMTEDDFKEFLKSLHAKQVKQIFDSFRFYIGSQYLYEGDERNKVYFHYKEITRQVLSSMEHIPNKKESKEARKLKQKEKQNR